MFPESLTDDCSQRPLGKHVSAVSPSDLNPPAGFVRFNAQHMLLSGSLRSVEHSLQIGFVAPVPSGK
jgi:hypothetical protein